MQGKSEMAELEELFRDQWGTIAVDNERKHIEILWFEATAEMSDEDFMAWLERFAGFVERGKCDTALVDARRFRMNPAGVSMGWRDEHIIPRYNAAGLKKFAFVMPAGMPAIGADPAPEGPADFPTAYFADPDAAHQWLAAAS